ncbi:MAG: substrate-binding domain-containing protein [Armatimonadota bacterium]
MFVRFAVVLTLLGFGAFAGCRSNGTVKPPSPARLEIPGQLTPETFPVVNYSTSTSLVVQMIQASVWGLSPELRRIGRGLFVTFPVTISAERIEAYDRSLRRAVPIGTHQAYQHLTGEKKIAHDRPSYGPMIATIAGPGNAVDVEKPAELIVVARKPSPDELKQAKELGVELDVRPVALDAFVFLVHADNPVKSLSLEQIRGIFLGRITNWKQVGGSDQTIRPFSRNRNSGSEELMEELVMNGQKVIAGKDVDSLLETMSGVIDRVSSTPAGISYSVFFYANYMNTAPSSRLLGVNGVAPTTQTIANHKYPLTAEVYVVTRKDLKKAAPAARLRDWLLSPAGQKLISDSCYVPVTPERR